MGGRISEEDIARVRDAANIVEVIGSYVPLKRSGRSFMGLCPFHGDSAPSFHVYPEIQYYKCYGCQKKGSVFDFLMEMEKMEFREAVESLAQKCGIVLTIVDGPTDREKSERDRVFAALRAASFQFRSNLKSPSGAAAAKYVEGRGIDGPMVDRFLLGYALDDWSGIANALSGEFSASELEAAGLLAKSDSGRHYDRFRDRVTFPIADQRGRIVGFGGRCMPNAPPETPKYINSPETRVYQKNRLLYGFNLAREEDLKTLGLIVVEGYTDVILLHKAGLKNAVATCGTALTPEHVRLVRAYTGRVHLVYDGDQAGIKAMDRGLDLLAGEDLDLRMAVLPDGQDPADYVIARGGDSFRERLAGGRDILEFKVSMARDRNDMSNANGVARAADEVLQMIRRVAHPVKREEMIRRTSEMLGVQESALRSRFSQTSSPVRTAASAAAAAPQRLTTRSMYEGMVIEALIGDNSLIPRAMTELPPDCLRDPECQAAARKLYERHEAAGRACGPDVLGESPAGVLGSVCDRLLDHERVGVKPDFARLLSDAREGIARCSQRETRASLKDRLRKAIAAGNHEMKKQLLETLHDSTRPAGESE